MIISLIYITMNQQLIVLNFLYIMFTCYMAFFGPFLLIEKPYFLASGFGKNYSASLRWPYIIPQHPILKLMAK